MARWIAVVLGAAVLAGCGYDQMVGRREAVDAAWGQVTEQLQRRNEMIPAVVRAARDAAAPDRERVVNARARLLAGGSRDEQIAADVELTAALARLLDARRAGTLDPELARLAQGLADADEQLAAARERYNDAVAAYNDHIASLPQKLWAAAMGFEPLEPFASPGAGVTPPRADPPSGAS